MKKILLATALLATLGACSDPDTTNRLLIGMGYTNIVTTGHSFLGCGGEDTTKTGFTALSPTGTPVKGVVCSGWLKGSTVRFF